MLSGWVGDSTKYNIRLGAKILPRFLMFILIGEFFKLQMVNIAIALKALICILAGIKWIRYIRKENKAKYFKYSFWCIGIYWAVIILLILVKGELRTEFFLSTFAVMLFAMILMFRKGNKYLKVINQYYPDVMKKYNASRDTIMGMECPGDIETLETTLRQLKETAPSIVVDAIMERETSERTLFFHLEMVYIVMIILFGTPYLT